MSLKENIHNHLIEKKEFISFGIASLIGFLGIDFLIKNFFIKNIQLFSLDFVLNLLWFLLLVLFYYKLIIIGLSGLIERLLDKYEDKIGLIILASLLILGVVFHYKYNLFDSLISNFLEDKIPWIKSLK